jgi:hypothetical protein
MGTLKSLLICIGALFVISGCAAIPPPLIYLGQAMSVGDGISYIKTRKSLTDNIVSEMAGQDCRIFNFIDDKKVCKDHPTKGDLDMETMQTMLQDIDCYGWTFEEDGSPRCIDKYKNWETNEN